MKMMVVMRVIAIQMKITFLTLRTLQTWAKERAQSKEQPNEKAKENAKDMPNEAKYKGKEKGIAKDSMGLIKGVKQGNYKCSLRHRHHSKAYNQKLN